MNSKSVYTFGDGKAEGKADMKNLLGGKGANLAEMNLIGVPVPAGFTISTEMCAQYILLGRDKLVENIKNEVEKGIEATEKVMNAKFGSKGEAFPLMVSVRSGSRVSMPGMMDTVLNLGLNDDSVKLLAEKSGNARFPWHSYRPFIQMYGSVVMGVAAKTHRNASGVSAITSTSFVKTETIGFAKTKIRMKINVAKIAAYFIEIEMVSFTRL